MGEKRAVCCAVFHLESWTCTDLIRMTLSDSSVPGQRERERERQKRTEKRSRTGR